MKTFNRILILLIFWNFKLISFAQEENKLFKTNEKITKYDFEIPIVKGESFLLPVGDLGGSILYLYKDNKDSIYFYKLDEENYNFKKIFNELKLEDKLYQFSVFDSFIFCKKLYFSLSDDIGYSELNLQTKKNIFTLDSIYNADKKIHSSFSADRKILIVNTLNTLSDYYNPEQDDRFMVYYLDSINVGKIKREYIPCTHCADGYLIGKDLFFTKSNIRDDFSGGFAWKDIYKAPWGKLQDSVKIAAFSEIIAISPDGKYILGTRHFDLPNSPCAIFDVENKKYQLLLGRNYSKAHAFYSYKEKKFAFDFGGWLVYVDFPKEFPFDALRKDNPDIPRWSNKEFYKQFELPPFETNK
jgi:hypothetical protein